MHYFIICLIFEQLYDKKTIGLKLIILIPLYGYYIVIERFLPIKIGESKEWSKT